MIPTVSLRILYYYSVDFGKSSTSCKIHFLEVNKTSIYLQQIKKKKFHVICDGRLIDLQAPILSNFFLF